MNNYLQPGITVTLTAPAGGVTSGNGYQIGQIFVVAANDADAADPFEGVTAGVFTLPKETGTAWSEGDPLYWDDGDDEVSKTATGNLLIGTAMAAALSGDTTGRVRLNGTSGADAGDLGAGVVGTTEIADAAVTTVKIADLNVTTGKLAADAVDGTKIADDAVDTEHLAADAVDTTAIADAAVTAAKALAFVSTEQTGTGSPQNIAHGLGATPSFVLPSVTEDPAGTGFDVAEGAHDATNVVVTVTTGVKFKVLAWA